MSKLRITSSSILILALTLALGACASSGSASALQASGTVETRQVVISSDLGGQITSLNVAEGETVEQDDVLLRLDDSLFLARRAAAEAGLQAAKGQLAAAQAQEEAANAGVAAAQAGLNAARAQFELARAGALAAGPAGANAWSASNPDAFDRPSWYFDPGEQVDAAQAQIDDAATGIQDALDALDSLLSGSDYAGVAAAESSLAQARAAYLLADRMRRAPVSGADAGDVRTALNAAFDAAEADLQDAQDKLDGMLSDPAAASLLARRVDLSLARQRYRLALEDYYALLTGELSPAVAAAQAALDAAAAAVTQAQAGAAAAGANTTQAGQAVDQAQAALDLVNAQIERLTLRAPVAGVVLTLGSAQGEQLLPGTPALTIGRVDQLTITVYIPEDRYGEVSVGEAAQVSADSFPGQTFAAQVTRIADQAEYTPRNVQTKEERQTTVYAVELTLLEGLDQLKPGMPADVTFTPASGSGG